MAKKTAAELAADKKRQAAALKRSKTGIGKAARGLSATERRLKAQGL